MPLLFSYGTLQDEEIQLSTFGRRLRGERDELPGFEAARVPIAGAQGGPAGGRTHHANAAFTGLPASRIGGTVFEVTASELAAADEFERPAGYKRIAVRLASARRAWVYVHAASAPADL